jgi:hypothetical protein
VRRWKIHLCVRDTEEGKEKEEKGEDKEKGQKDEYKEKGKEGI